MRAIDMTFEDAGDNLRFDECLLRLAEAGQIPGALRFWESQQPFVVLGRSGRLDADVDVAAVKRDGIAVYRRSSGGGTVVQGPGCLNYAFVLDQQADRAHIRGSYRWISAQVLGVLSECGIDAQYEPISDLALEGCKFSGNAQRRSRRFLLHHGTLLYDFELASIARYLKLPAAQPPYRANRSHAAFVRNVPVAPAWFKQGLSTRMGAQLVSELTPQEVQALAQARTLTNVETLLPAG